MPGIVRRHRVRERNHRDADLDSSASQTDSGMIRALSSTSSSAAPELRRPRSFRRSRREGAARDREATPSGSLSTSTASTAARPAAPSSHEDESRWMGRHVPRRRRIHDRHGGPRMMETPRTNRGVLAETLPQSRIVSTTCSSGSAQWRSRPRTPAVLVHGIHVGLRSWTHGHLLGSDLYSAGSVRTFAESVNSHCPRQRGGFCLLDAMASGNVVGPPVHCLRHELS